MNRIPQISIPEKLELTPYVLRQLSNGTRLYTINADEFEVVRLSFVFHAGPSVQSAPFVAGATANLLAEESSRMSGREIAEQLDFYGSYYEVNLDRDYVYVSFCALRKFFNKALDVAREILLHPTFPQSEVATYSLKRKQQLAIERQKVDVKARELFVEALFGESHPYGISYPESEYDNLNRELIVDHYSRYYNSSNCIVVCSGHIGKEEQLAIEELCCELPQGEKALPFMPKPTTNHEVRFNKSDAVQSAIRIGRILFTRNHPDFVGMQMVATILGGYFGARLMRNLREERGYTYGVMSTVVNFEYDGYFAIATQVGSEVCNDALNEIYKEIERLRHELMSDEELTLAKNILTGEMMRILDGPFGIADVAIENILSGRDEESINQTLAEIRAITPERVRELAYKYLDRQELATIIVGALE